MMTPDHANPAMRVRPAAEPPRGGTDDDAAGVEWGMTTPMSAEPRKPSEPVAYSDGEGRPSDGRKGGANMSVMDIFNALGVDLSEAEIVISRDGREITITPKGDAP